MSASLAEAKQAQRRQGIAARRALDPAFRRAADAAICERIAALAAWRGASRVLAYAALAASRTSPHCSPARTSWWPTRSAGRASP